MAGSSGAGSGRFDAAQQQRRGRGRGDLLARAQSAEGWEEEEEERQQQRQVQRPAKGGENAAGRRDFKNDGMQGKGRVKVKLWAGFYIRAE